MTVRRKLDRQFELDPIDSRLQVFSLHKDDPTHEVTEDPTGILPNSTNGIETCTAQATDWTHG
jgi:hypothetical protein